MGDGDFDACVDAILDPASMMGFWIFCIITVRAYVDEKFSPGFDAFCFHADRVYMRREGNIGLTQRESG